MCWPQNVNITKHCCVVQIYCHRYIIPCLFQDYFKRLQVASAAIFFGCFSSRMYAYKYLFFSLNSFCCFEDLNSVQLQYSQYRTDNFLRSVWIAATIWGVLFAKSPWAVLDAPLFLTLLPTQNLWHPPEIFCATINHRSNYQEGYFWWFNSKTVWVKFCRKDAEGFRLPCFVAETPCKVETYTTKMEFPKAAKSAAEFCKLHGSSIKILIASEVVSEFAKKIITAK